MSKKTNLTKIRRNLKLYPWLYFFRGCLPSVAIAILFFEQVTGSYFLASLIFAIVFISISVFEIPCGMFSDQYLGRRKTLILGAVAIFATSFFYATGGVIESFSFFVIGAILEGMSEALISGTNEGLLFESMKELRKGKHFHEVSGRCQALWQAGMVIGTGLGFGVAYLYSLQTAMWLNLIFAFGMIAVSFFLVEPKCLKTPHRTNIFLHMRQSLGSIKNNKLIRTITCARLLNYSAGEVLYRFEVAFFNSLIPLWAITFARIERQVLGVISFWFSGPVLNRFGFKKTLPAVVGLDVVTRSFGIAINSIASPFILPFSNLVFGVEITGSDTLLQREFSSEQRATIFSLISLMVNICKALLYVFIGVVADWWGIWLAMLTAIAIKGSSIPFYLKISKIIKD